METMTATSATASHAFFTNTNTSTSRARTNTTTSMSIGSRAEIQIIVKLDNAKSHLLKFNSLPLKGEILAKLSAAANLPSRILYLRNSHILLPVSSNVIDSNGNSNSIGNGIGNGKGSDTIFLSAYTFSPILGGKGGFGTLLKGLSKQAGAKQTTDFGACRDLNGRRLRHVNDELKLQKWRQAMQRRAKLQKDGLNNYIDIDIDIDKEVQHMQTETGVRNWHLTVPSWGAGEISQKAKKKEELKMKRELQEWARQENEIIATKLQKKRQWEKVKVDYATVGLDRDNGQDDKLTYSILEGMKKRRKLEGIEGQDDRHRVADDGDDGTLAVISESKSTSIAIAGTTSFLCTLSGDVVVEDEVNHSPSNTDTTITMIQSKSKFATAAILIDANKFNSIQSDYKGLYYEIIIDTEGIAQIGWAKLTETGRKCFIPNSDTGDGVGDDAFSYGYDGLRGMVFHDSKEIAYGKESIGWKKGDIIGCLHDFTNGSISFSVNGKDFGHAFDVEKDDSDHLLHPVLSLNENEIIGMNIGTTFRHCPKEYLAISALVVDQKYDAFSDEREDEMNAKQRDSKSRAVAMIGSVLLPSPKEDSSADGGPRVIVTDTTEKRVRSGEPIDLEKYRAAQELEAVGMDMLKKELFRLGCKCGGSTSERAKRLYSLKGLSRDQIPQQVRGKNFGQSQL